MSDERKYKYELAIMNDGKRNVQEGNFTVPLAIGNTVLFLNCEHSYEVESIEFFCGRPIATLVVAKSK